MVEEEARDILQAERASLQERLAELTRSHQAIVEASVGTTDDEHDPEGHTVAVEREQVAALSREANTHLAEVEAAIERFTAGTYGICTGCGQPIAPARLEARPSAPQCIACATAGAGRRCR